MKTLKRFAAVAMAGAMMAGSAMTAMAATPTSVPPYFYLLWNADHDASTPDEFAASPMGDECIADFSVDEDGNVTMLLQEMSYGGSTGSISNAYIDSNGNGQEDEGESIVATWEDGIATSLAYNQYEQAVDLDENYAGELAGEYVPVHLEFEVSVMHLPYDVYIPVIE